MQSLVLLTAPVIERPRKICLLLLGKADHLYSLVYLLQPTQLTVLPLVDFKLPSNMFSFGSRDEPSPAVQVQQ